ncbi:hypothetical protein ACQVRX_21095 (plasmid) [Ralstonia pseudosolanacearum]
MPDDSQGCVLVGMALQNGEKCHALDSVKAYAHLRNAFDGTSTPVSTPDKTITVEFVDQKRRQDLETAPILVSQSSFLAYQYVPRPAARQTRQRSGARFFCTRATLGRCSLPAASACRTG